MRVLHVIPGVAAKYGGPSKAVIDMCRSLIHEAVDVTLISTDANGNGRLDVPLLQLTSFCGIRTIFFPRQGSCETFKLSMPMSRWLRKNVRNYDVVHIHSLFSHSSMAAARVCRFARVPYVLRPLGSLTEWAMRQKSVRKRLFMGMIGRRLLRGASAVHYTSLDEKEQSERILDARNGVVLPLGFERVEIECSNRIESRLLLILGRLHPVKGLEQFIDAFADVVSESPFSDWQALIAGDGEPSYVSELKRCVEARDKSSVIGFAGWVEGEAKDDLFRRAAVLVSTSQLESFGITIVEAMSRAIPVLVSRRVALAKGIADAEAGWVYDGTSADLRRVLRACLQSKDRERRGENAMAFSRRFSWEAITPLLLALYTSLTNEART